MVNRYLESGKEDNAGVDAAYKVTDQVENISRKIYHHGKKKNLKRQKKITKLGKSIENQEKKLFFKKNMEEMKKSADYQNTSRLRQFFKRRQYKSQIQKKYKDSVKNRIKKSFIEGSKRFGEFVKSRGKKIIFLSLLALGIFFILFQAGSMMMNMGTGMVGNTVSTTYLSSEDTLKEVNQEFSSLEQALQEEMDSVEENHPGYDEYIINGKDVQFMEYLLDETEVKSTMENYLFTNGRPMTKSILAWWMFQNPEQNLIDLSTKMEIEHIYSKKRQENENSLFDKNNLERLGNKALLEKSINIRASDYRFEDKKKYYNGFKNNKGLKKDGTSNIELIKYAKYKNDFTEKDIENRTKQILLQFIDFVNEQNLFK